MKESKPYNIPKQIVLEAYKLVKANKGSHFPSSVMAVEIPKKLGGTRRLGIPTMIGKESTQM